MLHELGLKNPTEARLRGEADDVVFTCPLEDWAIFVIVDQPLKTGLKLPTDAMTSSHPLTRTPHFTVRS
jgi:hypothetical protein